MAVQGKDGQQKEAVRETVKEELAFLVTFVEVSRKIHAHDSLQMHEKLHKIVTQNSLSCAWKSILFVCSFSPTPSVVFFVAVKKCEIPQQKPLDESLVMNTIGLKKLISWGSAASGVSQWIT